MDTRYCHVGDEVLQALVELFVKDFSDSFRPVVIADENTWAVAGSQVQDLLVQASLVVQQPYIFPAVPMLYGDEHSIAAIHQLLCNTDLFPIAVGSGTINDIVKRASYETDRPYIVVATAPSVDGYTSYGAAVSIGGFKQTLPCSAPYAVFAQRTIICNAPMPMLSAGYGDLAAKVPAGADWLIADALDLQPIQPEIWNMIQPGLKASISQPKKLVQRDKDVVGVVFDGLAQTGFAMQRMHDSRPASGAEHLISHVWEMEHLCHEGIPVSHGFKVALGTLASTAMLQEICQYSAAELDLLCHDAKDLTWEDRAEELVHWLDGRPSYEQILEVSHQKFLEGPALERRRQLVLSQWDDLRGKILDQIIPFNTLRTMFIQAGCPVEPLDIGVSLPMFKRALVVSQMIRTRYTILDLLYEMGLFGQVLDTLTDTVTYFSQYQNL